MSVSKSTFASLCDKKYILRHLTVIDACRLNKYKDRLDDVLSIPVRAEWCPLKAIFYGDK